MWTMCVQDDKSAADASIPTLSPVELHVKSAIVQRTETGAFVVGAGYCMFLTVHVGLPWWRCW